MPAVLALLSSLFWGTADYLGGTATRRLPALVVVVVSQLAALVCLVPLALALGADPRSGLGAGIAAGLVGPLALLAFYRALATGTMGVVAPIAALGVAVPVVAGLAGGESPSGAQLVGIAVAVCGVLLACGPELGGAGRGGAVPLLLALLAALGFGAVFVLLAEGVADGGVADVVGVLVVMRGTSVLLLGGLLVLLRAGGGLEASGRAAWPLLVVLVVVGVLDVGANGTYAVATQSDLVSVTAVLASLYPVVTAVLAWRVDGERLSGLQWCGVALAMTGVVLLAAG